MKTWARLAAIALAAAAVPTSLLVLNVIACGPDFEPEVFLQPNHPDAPKLYAEGHLGVLQGGYYHAELVVAYRYLSGGKLSDAEKAAYLQGPAPAQDRDMWSGPAVNWLRARQVAENIPTNNQPVSYFFEQERAFKKTTSGGEEMYFVLNCPDPAFTTAVDTLQQRTKRWGSNSVELLEWAHGQDAVFSNCNKEGTTPEAAKAAWPLLLQQDRAYQIAAAKFYSGDYDGAIADFEAIAKDKASPWSAWGEYLAARAEVRKAATVAATPGSSGLGNFDKDRLKTAQARLLKVEKETKDDGIRHAAEEELGFVEVRLDPGKRLDQVSVALAGPKPDADFVDDLGDLDYLMDRGVAGDSELARWIKEIQFSSPNPATGGPQTLNALSMWQKQRTPPWLVAAMAQAPGEHTASGELMDAAAAVRSDSPAYATVNYYRVGLLLSAGKKAEARTLADTAIAGLGKESMASTRNAFLAERIQTARSLGEFLEDAPRTMIASESSAAEMMQCSGRSVASNCSTKIPPQQLDEDAATYMNLAMPIAALEQAAESTVLPQHLREAVASMAWVRAIGLGDAASVSRMAKLLPAPVLKTAGESDGFPATLALLRNPGLRPYLEQGVQRSASYSELDHYRDNWWCGRWADGSTPGNGAQPAAVPSLGFVTTRQRQQADDEAARLNALPAGLVWVGQRAMVYVKAHPEDKDAPEALALVVHGTRYGCDAYTKPSAQSALSKEAFEMLHRLYPKSAWALRTKYYY